MGTLQIRTLEARLAAIGEQVIRLEQRAATGTRLDQAIWTIWQDVRETKNSLDSERQCKRIKSVVVAAVGEVEQRCEDLAVQLEKANAEITALKKQLKGRTVKDD